MKKRLLSLLVAISMVLTFLPVSALTAAAAEDSSNGELKIGQNGYPVLDHIPHQTVNGHDIYTGDGWTYDADENCKILTLCPSAPTNYDFWAIHEVNFKTNCNLVIGSHAAVTGGSFNASVTNRGTITGGIFGNAVTNHGKIIGGKFYSSVTNESDGIIENGQFGRYSHLCTVTNNSGTINGGTFQDELTGSGIEPGYTLTAITPNNFISVSVNGYRNSCYIIPNQTYHASVRIVYAFDDYSGFPSLPPLDVAINSAQHMLLSDWCGSDLKIEFKDISGVYEVTFTAPPANGSTVTISPLTRLVIDKDGYPAKAQDWNGNRANYTGDGWNFDASNSTLTLTKGSYDFSARPLNPDVQLVVESGAALTGGAFKNTPTGEGAGTFKTVTLNGTGSITAVNGLASGDWGNTLYLVKTGNNTITASKPILDINRILLESVYPDSSNKNTVCINIKSLNSVNALDSEADIILNQASHGLPLIMASNGTPVIDNAPFEADAGYYTYYGDGWHIQKSFEGIGTLYLTGGNTYNFRYTDPVNKTGQLDAVICGISNEYGIIEDGIFNTTVANGSPNGDPTKTHKIEGGTFAAGLLYNDGTITGGAFNGKDSIFTNGTVLSGNYRSVTVNGGAIVKVNDTFPLVYDKTTHDWCRVPHGICILMQALSSP